MNFSVVLKYGEELIPALPLAVLVGLACQIFYRVLYLARRPQSRALAAVVSRTRISVLLLSYLLPFWVFVFFYKVFPYQLQFEYYLKYSVLVLVSVALVETFFELFFEHLMAGQKLHIPHILRDIMRGAIYMAFALFILTAVFHLNLTPLLTTSAILSVILGLALQETLGSLFSGLAISATRPYTQGDWVEMGEWQGVVERFDWRSTTIKTLENNWVVIPNSTLSKLALTNYSAPTLLKARYLPVHVHYRHSPEQVRSAILEAIRGVEGVSAQPEPIVLITGFGDSAVTYSLKFWYEDFSLCTPIEAALRERIWYRFQRDEIEIPYPMRTMARQHEEPRDRVRSRLVRHLEKVDFISGLGYTALFDLANRVRMQKYAQGEVVVRQGDPGRSFYIIQKGEAGVSVLDRRGHQVVDSRLKEGDFFGEMSLLTGSKRSATVRAVTGLELLTLDKDDLRHVFRDNPELQEQISEIVARRAARTKTALEESQTLAEAAASEAAPADEEVSMSRQVLRRIRDFFAF